MHNYLIKSRARSRTVCSRATHSLRAIVCVRDTTTSKLMTAFFLLLFCLFGLNNVPSKQKIAAHIRSTLSYDMVSRGATVVAGTCINS